MPAEGGTSARRSVFTRRWWLAGAVLSAACADETIGPEGPDLSANVAVTALLSDPVTPVRAGAPAAALGLEVVYVSLPPGTLPSGSEVEVHNVARDTEEIIPVAAGGFDPVPVPASAGESLRFRVFEGWLGVGESERSVVVAEWFELVPAFSSPDIVRTYPSRGRRDVPVALSVLVVFTEPIDTESVNAESIQLLREGTPVEGTVELAADGLSARLSPSAPLAPSTEYVLRIASGVRDLDGDDVGREESVQFATGDPSSRTVLAPTDLCSAHAPTSVVTFADANLEGAIRTALGWTEGGDLTCELVAELTALTYSPGVLPGSLPPPPTAISSLVGIQNLTGLTRLVLTNHAVTDIGPLAGLTSLDTLTLSTANGTPPTISDIGPLRGLTRLRYLNLNNTLGVGDLSPLAGLTELEALHVRWNSIVDLRPLMGLTRLSRLNLAGNAIVDATPLSALTSLTWLAVNENELRDIGPLAGLTGIGGSLWLYGNRITDLSPIAGMTGVTVLYAQGNRITNVGGLERLPNLQRIHLDDNPYLADIQPLLDNTGLVDTVLVALVNTNVSCEDVARLQSRLPRVSHTCGFTPVVVTTSSLPEATVGVGYNAVLMATGGSGVYTWIGSGLPAGLTLSGSGLITGTPASAGRFRLAVGARSSAPTTQVGRRYLSITIAAP